MTLRTPLLLTPSQLAGIYGSQHRVLRGAAAAAGHQLDPVPVTPTPAPTPWWDERQDA